jgi:hypothetical protein
MTIYSKEMKTTRRRVEDANIRKQERSYILWEGISTGE